MLFTGFGFLYWATKSGDVLVAMDPLAAYAWLIIVFMLFYGLLSSAISDMVRTIEYRKVRDRNGMDEQSR